MNVFTPNALRGSGWKPCALGKILDHDVEEIALFVYPAENEINRANGDGELYEILDFDADFSSVLTERGSVLEIRGEPIGPYTTVYFRGSYRGIYAKPVAETLEDVLQLLRDFRAWSAGIEDDVALDELKNRADDLFSAWSGRDIPNWPSARAAAHLAEPTETLRERIERVIVEPDGHYAAEDVTPEFAARVLANGAWMDGSPVTEDQAAVLREVCPVPINPELPPDFGCTPNDARPESHRVWWHRPYILTDDGPPVEDSESRIQWLRAWPSGTRYDVYCLDGGAWDRPTSWGKFGTLGAALACASSGGR